MKHSQGVGVFILVSLVLVMTSCDPPKEEVDPDLEQMRRDIEASFEEFDNRTIYKTLDPDIILSIPEDKLEQAVFDYIAEKIGADWNREREVVESLGAGFRAHYATWTLEAEVNNGGYNQFFWNSSGYWIHEAIAGFRLFGATDYAENAEEALRIYELEQESQNRFKEQGTLEAFSESYEHTDLGAVDDQFFNIKEDLSQLKVEYIRANPLQFSGD